MNKSSAEWEIWLLQLLEMRKEYITADSLLGVISVPHFGKWTLSHCVCVFTLNISWQIKFIPPPPKKSAAVEKISIRLQPEWGSNLSSDVMLWEFHGIMLNWQWLNINDSCFHTSEVPKVAGSGVCCVCEDFILNRPSMNGQITMLCHVW